MARHQWTLALILICIPILATVITAFRVRDLPKTAHETQRAEFKKQKCDDCDVNEPKVGQKLHSVKIESAKRAYEDLKKATRDKLQATSQKTAEVKSTFKFKFVNDEDEDDDDDEDFFSSEAVKTQAKTSKSGKHTSGLKSEVPSKRLIHKTDTDEDDDDDDDDDDDHEDKSRIVKLNKDLKEKKPDLKYKDSSKETKSIKLSLKKKKNEDDDDDDDDDDDEDDDDDDDDSDKANDDEEDNDKNNLKIKSRLDQISKDLKKKKVELKLKSDEIKKDIKVEKSAKVGNDDSSDDGKKANPKISITVKAKNEPEQIKTVKQEDKPSLKEIKKDVISDDAKQKKVTKGVETPDAKPVNKKPVDTQRDSKPDTKVENQDTKKQAKVDSVRPVEKKEEKKDTKEPKSDDGKKKDVVKPEKEAMKPKPQEKPEPKLVDAKKTEKKPDTEPKKKYDTTVKPKPKEEKSEPERKKHTEKDSKKDKSSKEASADSREALSKTETHLKHVTDALQRRNLLQSEFEDFYAFFPTFAPNFSRIHNPECRRHGQIVLRQLRGTKLWAFSMLDATAKIPSGILQGNGIQLGDFDQCLGSRARVQLESGSVVKVQGKYCLARLDVKAEHPDLELPVHLALSKNLIKSRIDDPGHFVPRFSTLSWGVCVPAACDPEDVEVVIKDAVKHYQYTSGLLVRVKVDPSDCHVQDGGEWWDDWLELPTLLTLSFYGVIILLVFVATLQDYFGGRKSEEEQDSGETYEKGEGDRKENEDGESEETTSKKKKDGILSAFSLYHSVGKLLAPGCDDEISCIHGVRGLATLALLVAHKFLPVAVMPYTNRLKITETVSSPLWSWCRAGWMFTDCFLLLSGALLAHRLSADSDTSTPKRLFLRYIRLTPALLAVVLFYAYVWDNVADGPMWGTFVTKNAEVCQEGWWWNLLYVQNYFGFEEMCAPQTHQLALDMQLTILGSILVWALNSELAGARLLIPGIHAIATYSRYATTSEHRLTMLAYHGVSVSQLYRTARLSYTSALHRSTPYLIGLSLGLALRNPSRHGKFMVVVGWFTSATLWCLVWWAGFDSGSTQYRYSVTFAAQYAAFAPLASALAIAWVIYIVHNQHSEWVSRLLCCRFLVLISRLSYALYLCQFVVFLTNAGTVRSSTEFTLISLVDAQEISAILLSSTVLTLTFVIPMQSLHKMFTCSKKPDEPIAENSEESENKPEEKDQSPQIEEPEEVIEVPQIRTRQHLVAHREVLEEIPEVEVEFEMQRQKNDGLEEILEEEEDEEERTLDEDDLEIIEEEQGGEDDIWEDREQYTPRRLYRRDDDDRDLDEWEWTTNGNGRSGAQYYRYTR